MLTDRLLPDHSDQCDSEDEQRPRPSRRKMGKKTIGSLTAVAIVLLIIGVAGALCWLTIFNSILLHQLILSPTSRSYGIWRDTPIPMYLNLYLWNWTNPEEFSNSATNLPNFVEMGPYVFREEHIKVNEIWNDNGTITYQQRRIWHFEESMSNGSLDDQVTNLNVIAVTIGHFVRDHSLAVRLIVNRMLEGTGETLIVTKTAGELLFDGYEDTILSYVKRLNISGIHIPFDKFGWFYDRNGSDTYDGVFNMHTGSENILNLGILEEWNYSNTTDNWNGECNTITGTSGELWPPLANNKSVELFAPDICTSIHLTRQNDSCFHGVTGHTFTSTDGTFDNGTEVPSRACYCDKECYPSGVLDVSHCKFGAPAYVGLPHFYRADQSYLNAITGMHPTEDHDFEITLEPNTGIPLNVKAQIQINILVQSITGIRMFRRIPKTFVPMLWFTQDARLTPELASQIKLLNLLPYIGHVSFSVIAALGLSLFLLALYLAYCGKYKKEDNQSLIPQEDDSKAPETNAVIS